MVTESVVYIGTSNWAANYFTNWAGIGFILEETSEKNETLRTIRDDTESVFQRDWNSTYAFELDAPIPTSKLFNNSLY